MSGKVGRVAGVLCCLCSEDKIIGRCVVKALVVGFLIFTLFKVLSWVFFILCSNVMNSYQKIFGANLRSHDPPPRKGVILLAFIPIMSLLCPLLIKQD